MVVSDTFNPYTFHESGTVQTTTRFDGDYDINRQGNYYYAINLKNDTVYSNKFYGNENRVKYNDGFFFGIN